MVNNSHPHSHQNIFSNQANPTKTKDAHGDVRQDKRGFKTARRASRQLARSHIPMRAEQSTTNTTRSKNPPNTNRQKVPMTFWVEPIVKTEILRRAEVAGLSPSLVGAEGLKKWLQQDADIHYGALLRPVIEDAIKTNLQTMSTRLALLLVRVAFASEQTRSLATNILRKQPGITPEALTDILDRSAEAAKSKITKKTPQLEKVIAEVKDWLLAPDTA